MVNEAVIRDNLNAVAMDFTVADETGIEKGTLLALSDPRTAAASAAEGGPLAGIAAREKIASDGRTRLSVYRSNIVVDMKASGAIDVGRAVMSSGAVNEVKVAAATVSGAGILGYALETAADAETIQIYVNVGSGGSQLS